MDTMDLLNHLYISAKVIVRNRTNFLFPEDGDFE
jgi:hypothetical protein